MTKFRILAAALAVAGLLSLAAHANAQCGANGTGQCGTPANLQTQAQQAAQLQFNNGLAAAGVATSAASTCTTCNQQPAQFAQVAVPTAQLYFTIPAPAAAVAAVAAPVPEDVANATAAAAAPVVTPTVLAASPYSLIAFTGQPAAAAAAGSTSASSSASAAAPVLAPPLAVAIPTTSQVSNSCAACSQRTGLLGRFRGRRSSSRSVSISRSRVR